MDMGATLRRIPRRGGSLPFTKETHMSTKSNSKLNVTQQNAADQALVDGFNKHQATLPASLIIGGVAVPTATIISTLSSRIAARAAVVPARATYQALVQANRDELSKSKALVSGAREALKVMFAGQVETLADFGLKPRKAPTPRTPEQKAVSVAKAKATRAARHTMGPKEKAKITGENPQGLPPVAPPPPAPPAPTPGAAPATTTTKS
jgi:hypothetical protein